MTLLAVALTLCSCAPASPEQQRSAVTDFAKPYPPAGWRLAPHQLKHVVLTAAHILIRHDANPFIEGVPLSVPSRASARAKALEVARLAHEAPDRFGELAKTYSDDFETRDRGGVLGTRPANTWIPAFLDALSTLRPGGISRIVETPRGFHVLRLLPTPAEEKLSARHIVICYEGGARPRMRPGRTIYRSREEALEFATLLAGAAAQNPDSFAALAELFSDHLDALRGGDMGVWSTHEDALYGHDLELIQRLPIGTVSSAVKSLEGFAIFLRTEPVPRAEFAAGFVRFVREHEGAPSDRGSDLPDDLREFVNGKTQSLDALVKKYGGSTLTRWTDGRGDPLVEQLIRRTEIGAVASTPIERRGETHEFYVRLPAAAKETVHFATTLPSPERPDVDAIVSTEGSGAAIASSISALRSSLGPDFGLTLQPAEVRRVSEVMDALEHELRTAGNVDRIGALNRARGKLRESLGKGKFAELQANLQAALTRRLLSQHEVR